MSAPIETVMKDKILPCLALALAIFLAYSNVYDNALLFDDTILISSNEYLKSWHTLGLLLTQSTIAGSHAAGGFYRPLQMLLYFFIYQLSGLEPASYHLLNVALHAGNAMCVFLLGRALGFRFWSVFLAALIWAMHPLHTEVIAYATGTAEPLMTFLCLLGLLTLLPDFTPKRIILSIPFFVLALLSKEGAVVFPALATTCLFLRSDDRLNPKTYFRTWPLWLIAIAYAIWRANAPGFDGPRTYAAFYAQHGYDTLQLYATHFSWRVYTFLATLPAYLGLLVWPAHLHMERNFSAYDGLFFALPLAGLVMLIAASAFITWVSLRRAPRALPLAWGLLWFAVAHFPNTGLIFPMNAQLLEHWMYMPAIGLFLGLAESVSLNLASLNSSLIRKKAPAVVAGGAVLLAGILDLRTFEQNLVWHDPFVFYANIFKYGEVSPRAHNNLANAYMDAGNYPAAIGEFQKAIMISDTYAEIRYNLALAFLNGPDPDAIPLAIDNLNRALALDPHFYRAWQTLANIYDYLGDKQQAAEDRKKAEQNFGK